MHFFNKAWESNIGFNIAGNLGVSSGSATQLTISNTSTSMSDGDTMGTIDFSAGSSNTVNARVAGAVEGTNEAGGDLVFETREDGGSLAERLRITSDGKVGIDTVSPGYSLQIGTSGANVSIGGAPTTNGSGRLLFLNTNATKNWKISTNDTTGGALEFTPSTADGGTSFTTPSMIIDSSGRLLVGTSSAFVDGFQNDLKTAQLSKGGTNGLIRCISDTREVAAVNNSTVDAWVARRASGSAYEQPTVGHFYVTVGGSNCFSAVYSIVTTSNGTSSATLTLVSSVVRGTSPVSSVQIAGDTGSGSIKLTITYINNAGVVDPLTSFVSFVGLAG